MFEMISLVKEQIVSHRRSTTFFVHDLEKLFALSLTFPRAVFHVADGLLLHPDAPPLLDTHITPAISACAYRDSISGSPVYHAFSFCAISYKARKNQSFLTGSLVRETGLEPA